MKKRMLSALLALCMVLTMAPAAFAAGGEDAVDSSGENSSAVQESGYSFVITAPEKMTVGEEFTEASATLKGAEDAETYEHAVIKIEVTAPEGAKPQILAKDTMENTYNLAETKQWGPAEGFKVEANYNAETPLTLSFDKAGIYTATFRLETVVSEGEPAVLAEGTAKIEVSYEYALAAKDIAAAPIADQSGNDVGELYDADSYKVTVPENITADIVNEIAIAITNLKQHTNAEGTLGYWCGLSVIAPEKATKMKYAFAANEAGLGTLSEASALEASVDGSNDGIAFYVNAGADNPKTYCAVQFFNDSETAITDVFKFHMDLSGVTVAEAENEDAEASIGKVVYNTLAEALKAAKSGDTVTLRKNVTVTNENDLGYGTSVVNVPAGVTLDGAENSIIAGEGFEQKDGKNNNSIVGAEAGAAIKNLSIIGSANTKHGINIFEEGTVDNPVVIENVTIKDCGNAGITVNKSVVKASGITTENNAWGSINVDKVSTFTLDGTNSLGENVQVWSDDANEESGSNITVNDENLTKVTGEGENLQGFLYYTDDVSKLGEAYNEGTKTVYESLAAALDAAQANETVHAVKDAALADNDEVKADVTLVVDPDVKLTIGEDGSGTLTNNGTIENHGTISGTVANGENGKEETYFTATFTIKPDGADLVVTDEEGNTVSAFEEGKYSLKKDAEYSYTVTATGYNKKSGKVTLTDNETIDVTLSRKSSGGSSSSSSSTNTITAANTNNGSVRISPSRAAEGATVTVTVTPDNGYELDRLTASANGSNIRLTDAGDGKYTFTMPSGNVTVTATFTQTNAGSELPFTDVARNAYYYDSVKWAVDNNITNGSSATAFSPETACTRAQMVTFLWRAAGSPKASTSNPFTDLDASAYYYEAVLWAVEKGVTTGTTETTFSPDAVVSRAQVVTFLNRYDGSTASEGSNPFTDVSSDAYYAGAVNWAVANNVTTGTTATTFSPDEDCTRAQIVTFMYRALVD